ncbi:sigma-54-dependent transcriptional regulator [Lentisalinibacter orientalis]|uniref:sigma-54-dependent transcriptional regulator n=1 Tax=Lentisalinibacter orientalis TaxID=2992241 RepID=UPI00386AB513
MNRSNRSRRSDDARRNGNVTSAVEDLAAAELPANESDAGVPSRGLKRPRALIVDDDKDHSGALQEVLAREGFDAERCHSCADAAGELTGPSPQVAFLALDIGDGDVLELLDLPGLEACDEIVLMHEQDRPRRIRAGMSRGAGYFLAKPFDEAFLTDLLRQMVDWPRRERRQAAKAVAVPPLDQFGDLRGSSGIMRELFCLLRKVAAVETSVLVTGESGTGKDLAARTIHRFSDRADGPFVAKNCAAIPPELCESELFGHEKGSFSGASHCHHGLFEQAHGGTLFLDEITEMQPEHQVKLLRVLESATLRRVGGERDLSADVRIIAASNREPDEAIADGRLREDLYYRIARFPIAMPPLRERGEDVEGLARYFLQRLNEREGCSKTLGRDALGTLADYPFPGNVRELQSLVERAFLLSPGEIRACHLPPLTGEPAVAGNHIRVRVGSSVQEAEKALILATLQSHGNDKSAAAETLGISLRTLYNRLNSYAEEGNRAS